MQESEFKEREYEGLGQMINTTARVYFAHVILFIYIFVLFVHVVFTRYDI